MARTRVAARAPVSAGITGRFPRAAENLRRYGDAAVRPFDVAGRLGWFALIGGRDMGWALTRYRKEIVRLIAEQCVEAVDRE